MDINEKHNAYINSSSDSRYVNMSAIPATVSHLTNANGVQELTFTLKIP